MRLYTLYVCLEQLKFKSIIFLTTLLSKCIPVEAMVSFTVLDKADASDRSVGRQLSAMCIKYSAIAEGALLWARDLASGPEFVTTAAYPTLSPCILSLARLICIYHPLSRPAVLEVAMIFMGHSNREISHQKMQSIKVWLMSFL